jgi:uncharacterized protein (DUF2267 family)
MEGNMAQTGLPILDTAVHKANEWLDRIGEAAGLTDKQRSYDILRATLHTVRDFIIPDEAVDLGAQLSTLIRGIYYEGWDPSKTPIKPRSRKAFLERVGRELPADFPVNPETAISAVLGLLSERISEGEVTQVRNALRKSIREIWPT